MIDSLTVNPDDGPLSAAFRSGNDNAELQIRAAPEKQSIVSLGEAGAKDVDIFQMVAARTVGSSSPPSFRLRQGFDDRLVVATSAGRTDVKLRPSKTGVVSVKDDLAFDGGAACNPALPNGPQCARIITQTSSLSIAPAAGKDVLLSPSGGGAVLVQGDLTLGSNSIRTQSGNLTLGPATGRDLTLRATGIGSVQIDAPLLHQTGSAVFESQLTVTNQTTTGHLRSLGKTELAGPLTKIGSSAKDAIDFNGHIKSCGTSEQERFFCSYSKLIFDADDDGIGITLKVPDPPNKAYEISMPMETGKILTSASKTSNLQKVGALEAGSIVAGFGTAEVAGLVARGSSNLYGDATIGISRSNRIEINGHISTEALVFDQNSDSVRYYINVPDPSKKGLQDVVVEFPMESGTILTTSSVKSALQSVGALSKGSMVAGFGSAEVASLLSTGFSHLAGDVSFGSEPKHEIDFSGHIVSSRLVFDANSDGQTLTFEFPDPSTAQKISFPDETGTILTSASTVSTLQQVGTLTKGSIGRGFGSVNVAKLTSTGQTELLGNVWLGGKLTDKMEVLAHITSSTLVFDSDSDGVNTLTLAFPDPTSARRIEFPVEDGTVLTTTSKQSVLTGVGALSSGSIVAGFGSATVTDLTATGKALLKGDVVIGDTRADALIINSRIHADVLVTRHSEGTNDFKIIFPRPAADRSITFPDETGTILTSVSTFSSLEAVGTLTKGSIATGFGKITTGSDISTTAKITAGGTLTASSNAELGSSKTDAIIVRGSLEVRGGSKTTVSVDPTNGNTYIDGNLGIGGSLTAFNAPFIVNSITTGAITEMTRGAGVTIEGVVFKNGGFGLTKANQINEFTEGQGVLVDGVLMRDGGIVAEASLVSTNPKGSIDLMTLVNSGRDFSMIGTNSNIKFRQYFQGVPDATSYAVDSGAITVGTETNWDKTTTSRNSFMSFSTVEASTLKERLRIKSNGDFHLNGDQLVVLQADGHVKMKGNVSIGVGEVGLHQLRVNSDLGDATFSITAPKSQASLTVKSGGKSAALLSIIAGDDRDAKIHFEDPSALNGASFDLFLDGSEAASTLKMTAGVMVMGVRSGQTEMWKVVRNNAAAPSRRAPGTNFTWNTTGLGDMTVSGHLTSQSATVAVLLETEHVKVINNTQLGSSVTDQVIIVGHLTEEYLTVDLGSDQQNELVLRFPAPTERQVISFPDETGQVLTTVSNISTLTAVGTMTSGNITTGFGYAHVASVKSSGLAEFKANTVLGGDLAKNSISLKSHIRESKIVFDANSDGNSLTLGVSDPTAAIPAFATECATWNFEKNENTASASIRSGEAVKVNIPWAHTDLRGLSWVEAAPYGTLLPISATPGQCQSGSGAFASCSAAVLDKLLPGGCRKVTAVSGTIVVQGKGYAKGDVLTLVGGTSTVKATLLVTTVNAAGGVTSVSIAGAGAYTITPGLASSAWATDKSGLPADISKVAATGGKAGNDGKVIFDITFSTETLASGGLCARPYSTIVCGYDAANRTFAGLPQSWGVTPGTKQTLDSLLVAYRTATKMLIDDSKSYVINVPHEDGTMLLSNLGKTEISGDVYLGKDRSDSIFIPGTIKGELSIEAPIVGNAALAFSPKGGSNHKISLQVLNQTAEHTVTLPDESGTLLTSASSFSKLQTVGTLKELSVNGSVNLKSDVVIGNALNDSVTIGGTIMGFNNSLRVFSFAGSANDGKYLHVETMEPGTFQGSRGNETLVLPDESGTIITTSSNFSVLTSLGNVNRGSLVKGFGSAYVQSLTSDGAALFNSDVTLGRKVDEVQTVAVSCTKNDLAGTLELTYNAQKTLAFSHAALVAGGPAYLKGKLEGLSTIKVGSITVTGGALVVDGTNSWTRTWTVTFAEDDTNSGDLAALSCDKSLLTSVAAGTIACTVVEKAKGDSTDVISLNGKITGGEPLVFEGPTIDDNELTLAIAPLTSSRTVTLPDETGTLLTTTSAKSQLTSVGALKKGSIIAGFGAASVTALTATGAATLKGDVTLGNEAKEEQVITLAVAVGNADLAGTFKLTFDSKTTGPIAFNAAASAVKTAVDNLASVGSVVVTKAVAGNGFTFTVQFDGTTNKGDQADILCNTASLTGTAPTCAVTEKTKGDLPDRILVNGHVSSTNLVFDKSGTGGTLTVQFPDPAVSHEVITFPALTGTVVLDTSTQTSITSVGALSKGTIAAGFGPVNMNKDISTTSAATITAGGNLIMKAAAIHSTVSVGAGTAITIPNDITVALITKTGDGTPTCTFTLPSGVAGQMLVIQNDHLVNCAHVSSNVPLIGSGKGATYVYAGGVWVEVGNST